MRRMISSVVLGALLLLVMPAARSEAWVRGGGAVHWHRWGGPHVVVAPFFGWGFYAPPAYTVVAPPPVVVVPSAPASGPWYYCQSTHAYYPQVPTCQEPWVQVPPS